DLGGPAFHGRAGAHPGGGGHVPAAPGPLSAAAAHPFRRPTSHRPSRYRVSDTKGVRHRPRPAAGATCGIGRPGTGCLTPKVSDTDPGPPREPHTASAVPVQGV